MPRRLRVLLPRVLVEHRTYKRRLSLVTSAVRNKEVEVNVSCSPPKCPAVLPPWYHDDTLATSGVGARGREPPWLTPRPRTGRSTGSLGVRQEAIWMPRLAFSMIHCRTPPVSPNIICYTETANSRTSQCKSVCTSNQQVANLNLAN